VSFVLALFACARGSGGERTDTAVTSTVPLPDSAPVAAAPSGGQTQPPMPTATATSQPKGTTPSQRQNPSQAGDRPTPPPPSSANPSGASGSDTARGRIAVVGSTPITQVVLRPATGQSITLTGALASEIRLASGADVWVRGRRVNERTFDVASYAVRTVDGVPAVTGTLTTDGDRLVLIDDAGRRHVVASPPSSLREHVGARVWISGDLSTGLSAYGLLRRRQ
jgi:hypothetical protein